MRHHAPSGKMLVHTFEMVKGKDLDKLMDAVDRAVGTFKATKESIMQSKALTDEEFTNLIETLDAVELDLRVPGIKGVLDKEGGKSISFEQSKRLLTLVEESFDRIEAACFLYARLIDISDRNKLLAELDSADRETVEMLVKEKKMMEKHELDTINPTFEGLTI